MEVTRMELLSRKTRPDGVIEGKVLMHGTLGESIQIQCEVPPSLLASKGRVNGALANEAIRQLGRMPEFRGRTAIAVSRFGMPKTGARRVINLENKVAPIAGCQAE